MWPPERNEAIEDNRAEVRYLCLLVFARRRLAQDSVFRRRRFRPSEDEGAPVFYVQPVGQEPAAGGLEVPDLLHDAPRRWGDLRGAEELTRFAFEGGDCAGVFDVVVDAVPLAPTRFDAQALESQLYIASLIETCFRVRVGNTSYKAADSVLRRVLCAPPERSADAAARSRVLAELASSPTLRSDLERIYVATRRLREALETAPGTEPNLVRRKIAVLAALRGCIDAMADGFDGAESLLARLREHGRAVRGGDAYGRLVELLDMDEGAANVDVRLRLGLDGRIRGFGVLAVRENRDNPLLPGPARRFFQRIAAFLRGHRYGESEVVVRLLDEVFAPLVQDTVVCIACTAGIELYLASLGFRDRAASEGLSVALAEMVEPGGEGGDGAAERIVEGLFNPLLFLQGVTPVPCDLPVPRSDALVVVTGPNSGGKTRFLQALALTQLLGQVGVFVPAARARLVRASSLFVSIVEEPDPAQVEGRLGTELLRVRRLFETLEPGSMAVIDELCSGTNPMEGEALFEMVVRLLPRLRPQVFVSTHFLGLAARLEEGPRDEQLAFLQVELDAEERPTFQLVAGVARTSLAQKIARRLGVTEDELGALIEAKLDGKGRQG